MADGSSRIAPNETLEPAAPESAPASTSPLTEDQALALLKQPEISPGVLEDLSKNPAAMKSRKVKLALVQHPRAPRHVSIPMVRHLFTFDLMQVTLTPVVPADVKLAADEVLINRLETISSGERLTLAHRGSGKLAAELLCDPESRVIQAALENGRLTEAGVIKAVTRHDAPAALVLAVCHHARWSLRREIRLALLRNQNTPLARALEFARFFPPAMIREILQSSQLPASVKAGLSKELSERGGMQKSEVRRQNAKERK